MTRQAISTSNAPAAVGPYSQAIVVGELVFCAGQGAIDPATQELRRGTVEEETERTLRNLEAVLDAAGATFADVVKTTVFLADINDFAAMNEVYGQYFKEPYPARATVQVARLPKDSKVEIDLIASFD